MYLPFFDFRAAKGILLQIHAEGRSDLPMLSLLGRTLKDIAVSSLERGHLDAAKAEMVLTQKICLEAFRRAKIEASLVLQPHPQVFRPSGTSGGAASSAHAQWGTEDNSASFASGNIATPSSPPEARAQWEHQCVRLCLILSVSVVLQCPAVLPSFPPLPAHLASMASL